MILRKPFLYSDQKSNKFWWIAHQGRKFVINYGRVGSIGKYQVKEFDTEEECTKEVEKLINQKLKKGYEEDAEFDFDNHLYIDDEEFGLNGLTSHPNFLSHFREEFYHDCVDEETPFGSDEGSDTLSELHDLARKKGVEDCVHFPKYLIEKVWDMKYICPKEGADDEALQRLLDEEEIDLTQSDMVTYAAAFGQIKIAGYVNKELKDNAIEAMKRMERANKLTGYGNSEILETMLRDLSSFDKIKE